MSPAEVEEKLRASMKAAQEKGWIIAKNVTIDNQVPRCCAIGAYLVAQGKMEPPYITEAADCFGIPSFAVSALTDGFDGQTYKDTHASEKTGFDARPFYDLGARLADEFFSQTKE